jgi:polysaccharide pyruvyl transferase WcaK-like protein
MIYNELDVQETLDIISASDAVVSTRLHSSIFSCATETPFLDITHSHKNKYFLETIKYEKASVGYEDFNIAKAKLILKNAIFSIENKEEIGSLVSINKLLLRELNKRIVLT